MSKTGGKTAAVIWLHGLGDSGASWEYLEGAFRTPHIKWIFPNAPEQPVSCNGGFAMPSWFDLKAIPVGKDDWDDEKGLAAAVADINKIIDTLEKDDGIIAERIAVGGFSQGGCLSILSVLSSTRKLAGAICFSGWVGRRSAYPGLLATANKSTPLFWGHGEADDKVPFATAEVGQEVLRGLLTGKKQLTFKSYPGMGKDK